jgi:diacylglycerol kinase (ATP)
MSTAIIINPVAGGARPANGRRRAGQAVAVLDARGETADIFVTERVGHARDLALAAIRRGTTRIVVWGGDGTVNEVASVLAFGSVPMGIVPAGSGNGLAWELGVPSDATLALERALGGSLRTIDVGEIEGRYFVNVAGIGFDAYVATRFAAASNRRRGFATYVWLTARSLLDFQTEEYRVTADGECRAMRALLVVLANGTEFGNHIPIAPRARVDDGMLDLVVVTERGRLHTIGQMPRLLAGRIERSPLWSSRQAREVTVEGHRPLLFHVDGEPVQGGTRLVARVHARALRVCV